MKLALRTVVSFSYGNSTNHDAMIKLYDTPRKHKTEIMY
jgi:signal recognition particle receptor subunit beta